MNPVVYSKPKSEPAIKYSPLGKEMAVIQVLSKY